MSFCFWCFSGASHHGKTPKTKRHQQVTVKFNCNYGNKKKYKTIIYQNHSEISLFELNFFDNKIKEPKDFILKLSDFSELIGHQKPKFILFNKYTENIEIETYLRDFIPRFIYETIFDFGVKKIFFLSKKQYEIASKITKGKNIIVFENISKIYDYIAKK